jgi:SAM-dependent methyltransferase
MDLTAWVRSQLPPAPARVLEVGCGGGELTQALEEAGWDVLGIDPAAPSGELFRPLKLEELEPEPFDAVVAVRSLHHVGDLPDALDRIAGMLPLGGPLVLEEFGWDRLDAETAAWFCGVRGAASVEACREEWEAEHVGLHGYAAMRAGLDRRFAERAFAWRPFLHRLLDGRASEAEEWALVESDAIRALGFRYVGTPR